VRDARTSSFLSVPRSLARIGHAAVTAALLVTFTGIARGAEPRPAPDPRVRAWQTGLLRPDRLQHASLSWTLGLAIGIATRRPAAVLGGVAAVGLAKEVADRKGTGFDPVDLAAGLIGGTAAALVTVGWRP
jgi:hypothetical protein